MDSTQSLKGSQVQGQQEITRENVYISYIHPLLEYSDLVWDNCSSDSRKQLEAIHTDVARVIVGATKLCSILTWDGRLFKVAITNTNLYFFTKSSMVLHLITSQSLYLSLFKKLLPITSEILTIFKIIKSF